MSVKAKVTIYKYLSPTVEVYKDGELFFKSVIKNKPPTPKLFTDKYGNIKLGGLTSIKYEDKLTKKIRKAMKPYL